MSKIKYIYVDGENVLHRISEILKIEKQVKNRLEITNFQFKNLIADALKSNQDDLVIRYYGTKIKQINDNNYLKNKTQEIMESQRRLKQSLKSQNIEFVTCGALKRRDGDRCKLCKATNKSLYLQEKGVDVKLAVDMIVNHKQGDDLYLVSSDNDLIPAIEQVIKQKISITYIRFSENYSQNIKRITKKDILLDNQIILKYYPGK